MNTKVIDWLECIWLSDLPSQSKYVAAYLRTYLNAKQDICFPAIDTICIHTGLSSNTVRKHLRFLEEKEWLIIERSNGRKSNRYQVNIPTSTLQQMQGYRDSNPSSGDLNPSAPALNPSAPALNPSGAAPEYTINKQITNNNIYTADILHESIPDQLRANAVDYWNRKNITLIAEDVWIQFAAHHRNKQTKINDVEALWAGWCVNACKYVQPDKKQGNSMTRLVDKSWANGIIEAATD